MKRLVLAFLLASSTPTFADAGAIAASATVDSLISGIRNSLSQLISEAETSATVAGFSFATDANILLQNLEVLGKELSGKVFSDLNASQQSVFSNALILIDNANRGVGNQIAAVDQVVANVGQEISRLPGTSKRPLLSNYSPSYVLHKDEQYEIRLKGSLLNSNKSTLYFGSKPCTLVSSVETEVRFSCPADAFSAANNQWTTGLLTLDKPNQWYKFWSSSQQYTYKIGMMVVQNKIGEYSVKSFEKRPVTSSVLREQSNRSDNGHCSGGRSVVWTYHPKESCKVDVASVQVQPDPAGSSTYEGVINLSETGFQVRGRVANRGSCGPFGVPRDARGHLAVRVNWTDACTTLQEAELPEQAGTLSWTEEKYFQLPSGVSKFILVVKQEDGAVKVFDKAGPSEWFTVNFDPSSKLLVLKPRALTEAFR